MPVMDPNAKRPKMSKDAFLYSARKEAEAMKKDKEMQLAEKQMTKKKIVKKK